MSLDVYFLISWIIGNEKITKEVCRDFMNSLHLQNQEDLDYNIDHMINLLNSIISDKSDFGGMYVWTTIGNYGVFHYDDLIPLFKKLYDSNAINPVNNIIILSQMEHCDMSIIELSWSGKDIEVRENYSNKLVWR